MNGAYVADAEGREVYREARAQLSPEQLPDKFWIDLEAITRQYVEDMRSARQCFSLSIIVLRPDSALPPPTGEVDHSELVSSTADMSLLRPAGMEFFKRRFATATTSFDDDIVYSNGVFVQYPEGI